MYARPKENSIITEICGGQYTGISVCIQLFREQKWTVKKSGGYYWIWRKGGTKLRMTETAFCLWFDLEE